VPAFLEAIGKVSASWRHAARQMEAIADAAD
jgi:hypothetical protein